MRKIEEIRKEVLKVFVHPCQYTSVFYTASGHVELYDELTLSILGRSPTKFEDVPVSVTFAKDFNTFLVLETMKLRQETLIKGKLTQKIFALPEGEIQSMGIIENPNIAVLLSRDKVFFLDLLSGEMLRQMVRPQMLEGRTIDQRDEQWWIMSEHVLTVVTIVPMAFKIDNRAQFQYRLGEAIASTDTRINLILIITHNYQSMLLIDRQSLQIEHHLAMPSFILLKELNSHVLTQSAWCLFRPAVNTHFEDAYSRQLYIVRISNNVLRMFLVGEHGLQERLTLVCEPTNSNQHIFKEIAVDNLHEYFNPSEIYTHNRLQQEGNAGQQFPSLGQLKSSPIERPYSLVQPLLTEGHPNTNHEHANVQAPHLQRMIESKPKATDTEGMKIELEQVWRNAFWPNSLLVRMGHSIGVVSIASVLGDSYLGRQWPCLGFKFEGLARNEVYEEREDQFEMGQSAQTAAEQFGLEQLNDWSESIFRQVDVQSQRVKRLQCLE